MKNHEVQYRPAVRVRNSAFKATFIEYRRRIVNE